MSILGSVCLININWHEIHIFTASSGYNVGTVIHLHRGRKESIRKWGWFACVKGTLSVQDQIIMSNSKPRIYMNIQWQCSEQYCESARKEENQTKYPKQPTSRFCDNHQHFHSSVFFIQLLFMYLLFRIYFIPLIWLTLLIEIKMLTMK